MNTVSVSSYSVREHLGPVEFTFPGPDGTDMHLKFPFEKLFELGDFPRRAKEELGVDAIGTVAFQFAGLDDPELDRFAAGLVSSGVRLIDVSVDAGDLLEIDPTKHAADIAEMKRWIARFAAMGAEFVRVNAGSPFRVGEHAPADAPQLVAGLRELGEYAAAQGTRLLIENHGGQSSDSVWLGELLANVGKEHVGLLLDLGNFDILMQPTMAHLFSATEGGQPVPFAAMLDAMDLTPLYDAIDSLAPYTEVVHVKVHDVDEAGVFRAVDLDRAFGILARHGYEGPLTVEYEGHGGDPWAKTRAVVDATRAFATQGVN